MDTLIYRSARLVTSRSAQRGYVTAALFAVAAALLLLLAVVAYLLFYLAYIPQMGVERVVHLQYGSGPHPHGIAALDGALSSQQPYDISLKATFPRTQANVDAGNFMLGMMLLSPGYRLPLGGSPLSTAWEDSAAPASLLPRKSALADIDESVILHHARRPASLTYMSRLVSLAERLLSLPLYVAGWKTETETLVVPMAERWECSKGWRNVPAFVALEIQSQDGYGAALQLYDVRITFAAVLRGLRWWMYRHWILSFVSFVALFWVAEVVGVLMAWLALRHVYGRDRARVGSRAGDGKMTRVKQEGEEEEAAGGMDPAFSDTERSFPRYGRQPPLKYERQIKSEEEEAADMPATSHPLTTVEADDEEEEDETGAMDADAQARRSDSGLGTSFSEGGDRTGLARRRSRAKGMGYS